MNCGIGFRLVQENQKQYIGREVAKWNLDLAPRPDHFDNRITVSTPLQKTGAYLVTAKMAGGNTSRIILWLADTAIVKKPMPNKAFYYVADAVTGKPIAKANVEFFGWWHERKDRNRFFMHTKNFAEFTDADGLGDDTTEATVNHRYLYGVAVDQILAAGQPERAVEEPHSLPGVGEVALEELAHRDTVRVQ